MLFGEHISQHGCVKGKSIDERHCCCYCMFLATFCLVQFNKFESLFLIINMLSKQRSGRPVKSSKGIDCDFI